MMETVKSSPSLLTHHWAYGATIAETTTITDAAPRRSFGGRRPKERSGGVPTRTCP